MKKSSLRHSSNKARSRTLSADMSQKVLKNYSNKKVPISQLTAISKKYLHKHLNTNSQVIKRFQVDQKNLNAPKFIQYLQEQTHYQKGTRLSNNAIHRAYAAFCNPEGKMTFEFILKRCEQLGYKINQKTAKGIIKKYGHRKDYLTPQQCAQVIQRRYQRNMAHQRKPSTPKKSRVGSSRH